MLAKYEPVVRSQIEKNEALTKETADSFPSVSAIESMGLVMADTGHLMYQWHGGKFAWVPHRVLRTVVRAWNWVVCRVRGHETFGPITDEDGTWIAHKTCMHCSKIWPNER